MLDSEMKTLKAENADLNGRLKMVFSELDTAKVSLNMMSTITKKLDDILCSQKAKIDKHDIGYAEGASSSNPKFFVCVNLVCDNLKSDRTTGELHSLGKPVEEIADYLKMTHLRPHVINTQMSCKVRYSPQDGILSDQLHSLGTTVEEIEDYLKRAHLKLPVFKVIKTANVVGSEMTNQRDPAAAMVFTLNHRIDRNDAPALPKNQNDAPAMPKKWNDTPALLKKQSTCSCLPLIHPRAFKCSRHRSATMIKKKPTRRADRVLVKRALAPPGQRRLRSCHRRKIFRPTPSRLSKMSME